MLAVRYVPPYTMQIRAKGFEKTTERGRRSRFFKEARRDSRRVARPEAFSMMDLDFERPGSQLVCQEMRTSHGCSVWYLHVCASRLTTVKRHTGGDLLVNNGYYWGD